jgi:hypothetical protein
VLAKLCRIEILKKKKRKPMKSIINSTKSLILFVFLVFGLNGNAQNVSVAGASSGNGSYPDLNSAFNAINGSAQTAANISITILGSTTETASAVLNAGLWSSLSIQPSGGTYTIGGNLAAPIIDLNGADLVSINGINSGGNALTISNSNTGAAGVATIRLIADATFNIITNCTILGSSTSATLGTITFSTASAQGNSFNTISQCNIGPAGVNLPNNSIFSSGTVSFENRNNTIQNCNIYDYFTPNLASCGIFVSSNNSHWNISGNRLYQTASRTYTVANTIKSIQINSGNGYTVTNNVIGYTSAAGTGTTTMAGTIATRFVGIELSVATLTASSVQNNTITAITLTTSSGATTGNGILCGINAITGNVNVSNNLIGGTSGVNLFSGFPTTTQGLVVGICSSSTGTINVISNYIGGCTSTGTTAAVAGNIMGINIAGSSGLLSVTNNSIGNITVNNMRAGTAGLTTGNSLFVALNLAGTPVGIANISNNLIQNGASFGVGTTGTLRGIYTTITSGSTTFSVVNNRVLNLTTDNGGTNTGNGQLSNVGIAITAGSLNRISNNIIGNISNTSTLTTAIIVGGISTAVSASPAINGNVIYGLSGAGTGVTATAPPQIHGVYIRGASGPLDLFNNMISLGTGISANVAFSGISVASGGGAPTVTRIYYNTINISGAVTTGALPSIGIYRGNFSGSVTFSMDIKNNLVTNTRTGGTGIHCAISNNFGTTASTTGWPANTSEFNVLNASNPLNVGWWTSAQTLAGWRTISGGDVNSFSGASVTYSNAAIGDLHLNMGTIANVMESGATPIAGFVTDIDGQTRPGPIGSVNGGGLTPDIGADEFDGVVLDAAPPSITHTALAASCSTADRTFTASIVDASGVPATGSLVPQVYYRKNVGAYVNSSGVLASGTASNGVWSFTISSAAMGGLALNDQVSYFLIAQDAASTVNIGSLPSSGLLATSVVSVAATPTAPFTYLVASLSGSYTVGSTGTYTSITAAANAYNNSCLSGPVTFVLNDALYSTNETFPIIFQNNLTANSTNSLLIIPSAGNAVSITPTLTSIPAVFKFIDARFITIDGLKSGGSSIFISNSNSTTATSDIWLASNFSGCNNIAVRNMTLTGGTNTISTSFGILGTGNGATPALTLGADNDNISITGNTIFRCYTAIAAIGSASTLVGGVNDWLISNNQVGPATPSIGLNLSLFGIAIQNAQNMSVINNTVSNVISSVGYIYGVAISAGVSNSTLNANTINSINYVGTGGYGGIGIDIQAANLNSNLLIQNNMISNISGDGWSSFTSGGYSGVRLGSSNPTGGVRFYNNSIAMNHSTTIGGNSTASVTACMYFAASSTSIQVVNNLLYSDIQYTNTAARTFAIYSNAPASAFTAMDFNNYSVVGTQSVLALVGTTTVNTLAGLQTAFGNNANSQAITPVFTSTVDLHLVPASNGALDDLGVPIGGLTLDIDNQTRNLTNPDIGADEFTAPPCTSVTAGAIAITSYSACTGQSITLSSVGTTTAGGGITRVWQVSSTPGGPYINVSTGTGTSSTSYNTGAISSPGLNYYVFRATCTSASLTSVSNEVTVSVNQTPTASLSVSANTLCSGGNLIFTGGTNVGTNFSWTGPNSFVSSLQNPIISNATSSASGTYSFVSALGTCSASAVSSVTVFNTPSSLTLATSAATICSGTSQTLGVTGGSIPVFPPVSAYAFSFSNSTSLVNTASGSTVLTSSNDDTPMAAPAAIGFNFIFNGVNYSQFTASPDGWILLGGAIGISEFSNFVTSTTNIPKIYPYWDDLATGTNGFVRTLLTGTAPNRVFIVEWFVTIPRATGGAANSSFQCLLYETSNLVEFRYGTMGSGAMNASSGLTAGSTNFNCLTLTGPSNSSVTANDANAGQPASGVSYSFTPNLLNFQLPIVWSPGAGLSSTSGLSVNATPTVSSLYTVSATNSGCSSTNTVSISVINNPTVSLVTTSTLLCSGASATLTASGAANYAWSTGATTSSIVVNPSSLTNYSVSGSNAPCVSNSTASVNINAGITPLLNVSGPASICTGNSATYSVSGANLYAWSTGSQEDNINVSPVVTTSYSVLGSDLNGCTAISFQTLNVNITPTLSTTGLSTICDGQTTSLTVSGASTYLWSNSATGAIISVSPSVNTTYSVLGTSAEGCTATAIQAMTVNASPTISVVSNPTVCQSQSISLTASGAISYTWNTGSNASSIVSSPTANTTYIVSGSNALGCSSSTTQVVTTLTSPTLNISGALIICAGQILNLTVSGANTYTWSTGSNATGISATPTVSTVYTVSGTNGLGCTANAIRLATVNALPNLTVTGTSSICAGQTANFNVTGANTYTWDTGSNANNIVTTPTTSTVYNVSGTDAVGCVNVGTISVAVAPLPNVNISGSSGICTGQTAILIANGASTYTWNNGSNSSAITDSPIVNTSYTLSGTDLLGCSNTATQLVSVAASLTITILGPSSICIGQTANLTGNGGVTYTWNTGATSQTIAPNPTVTTTYSVIGASGTCSNSGLTTVSVNPNPTVSISGVSSLCINQTGILTGSGANTYSWSTGVNTSTASVTQAATSIYTLTGFNTFGCANVQTVSVVSLAVPVINVAQSANSVCVNSPATFTASGANTYTWSTVSNNTVVSITPSTAASYTVNGTNTFGCVSSSTFALGTFSLPILSTTPSAATVCAFSQATFNAAGANTYTWNGSVLSQTASFSPSVASVYTLTGINSSGCVSSITIGVATNTLPALVINPSSATICAFSTASFAASGANTYTWNGSVNTSTAAFSPSTSSVYTLSGTNPAGCLSTTTLGVSTNTLPVINIAQSANSVCVSSPATFTASGANSYTWSTVSNNTTISITPTAAANYTVSGTNGFGCVSSSTFALGTFSLPVVNIVPASATVCSSSQVSFNAGGASTYTWNGTIIAPTASFAPLASTVYTVSGTNSNNCVSTTTVGVTTNTLPILGISPPSSTVCALSPASFIASGATTYTWNGTVISPTATFTPAASTVYSVTGTNPAGCRSSATVAVTTNTLPAITITPASTSVCFSTTATFTASGASTYSWVNGPQTAIAAFTPTAAGIYTVSGTNPAGCVASATINQLVNALPNVVITPASATVCSLANLFLTGSGATTYTWNGVSTATTAAINFTPTSNTVYTLVGTNANGCVRAATIAVTTNSLPVMVFTPPSATVCAQSPVSFTVSGANSYFWNSNNNTTPNSTFFPSVNSTYTVTGTTAQGCNATATVAATALPLPSITVSPSFTTVCEGTTNTYSASGAVTYTWNNTIALTGSTLAIATQSATSYSVIGTGTNGCLANAQIVVLTNTLPVIGVTASAGTVCSQQPVQLTSTGANTYTWSNSVVSNSTLVNPVNATTYSVSGTDGTTGCVGTQTIAIATYSLPVISISPASPSVCVKTPVTLSAAGGLAYNWSNGSPQISISVTPTANVSYTVTGTDALGCSNVASVTIVANPLPVIVVSPPSLIVCEGETANFTASGASTYTWAVNNSTSASLSIVPAFGTLYSVTGIDANGCKSSATATINVSPCTGIAKQVLNDNAVHLFPNPSSGVFTTQFEFDGEKIITISNSVGQVVLQSVTSDRSKEFDFSGIDKGIYFVHVSSKQASGIYKLVIH